jgi:hypothetical protein
MYAYICLAVAYQHLGPAKHRRLRRDQRRLRCWLGSLLFTLEDVREDHGQDGLILHSSKN